MAQNNANVQLVSWNVLVDNASAMKISAILPIPLEGVTTRAFVVEITVVSPHIMDILNCRKQYTSSRFTALLYVG